MLACTSSSSTEQDETTGDETSAEESAGEESSGGETGPPETTGGEETGEPAVLAEARVKYPDYKSFHQLAMGPKCGPVGGVCHNTKEFPDLHTSANMMDAIGLYCNVLADGPEVTENLCEPVGDVLVLTSGQDVGFTSQIGQLFEVPGDMACDDAAVADLPDDLGTDRELCMSLKDAVPLGAAVGEDLVSFSVVRPDSVTGEQLVLLQYEDRLLTSQSSKHVRFTDFGMLTPQDQDTFLYTIHQGDLNGDSVFGALTDESGLLIKPGDPLHSYIVWRMMGWGLAPRMPLAEAPMTPMMQLAMMCWIKQLDPSVTSPDPSAEIVYDDCLEFLEEIDDLDEWNELYGDIPEE